MEKSYSPIGPLYEKSAKDYTPEEFRKLLKVLLREMPARVRAITEYLYQRPDVGITPDSADEDLAMLPSVNALLGRF